jgi:outer membrane protein TolC
LEIAPHRPPLHVAIYHLLFTSCLLLPAFCLLFWVSPAFCAIPDSLSLNDCITIVLEKSLEIRRARGDLERAEANRTIARSPFYPNISLGTDLPDYSERTDRLQSDVLKEIVSSTEKSRYYRGNVNIDQSIPFVGSFSLSSMLYRWNLTSTFRQSRQEFTGDVSIWYRRTLLEPASADLALQQANLSFDAAQSAFQWRRRNLIYQTNRTYFDLVRAMKQVEIADGKLTQSKELYETARKKFDAGLIAEVEALRLQVAMASAESGLSGALLNVERAKDDLRNLLGLDLNRDIAIRTEIPYRPVTIDTARVFEIGQRRRADLLAARSRYRLQKTSFDQVKRGGYPKVEISAYYGLKGIGEEFRDIPETFDRNRWGVNMHLKLPVWDAGLSRAKTNAARTDLLNSQLNLEDQERKIVLDIRDAIRRIEEAKRRIDILSASVDVAKKSFEITQKRFDIGTATSKDLIDQQLALIEARTDNLNALIDYYLAIAALEQATMATIDELRGE